MAFETTTATTTEGGSIELPMRYNELGEWKPLVAKFDEESLKAIDAQILSETKNPEIQGILKYIRYTGRSVLEFVVRCNLDICEQGRTLGSDLHLYKCPKLVESKTIAETFIIYDSWVGLDFQTPEHIQNTIESIDTKLRLISSFYQVSLEWRPKYGANIGNIRSINKPDEEGINLIGLLLNKLPSDEDSFSAIEKAISWYSRGVSSKDVFVKFVSLYIALEVLAVLISEGKTVFYPGVEKKDKTVRRQEKIDCLKKLHDQLYDKKPIEFVEQGYFDCIQSLKTKTKKAVEKVFGEEHQFVKDLFEIQYKGYTLQNIRNKIAHGDFSKSSTAIANLVWERMPLIQQISREFIFRVLLGLKPTESLPGYSGAVTSIRSTHNPNGWVISDLSILPNKDWRIRTEWFDD